MAVARLQKELKLLAKDPLPSMLARPHPNNLLEWHYCLEGASDTAYAGGTYHGKIIFPKEYPFKAAVDHDVHAFRAVSAEHAAVLEHV